MHWQTEGKCQILYFVNQYQIVVPYGMKHLFCAEILVAVLSTAVVVLYTSRYFYSYIICIIIMIIKRHLVTVTVTVFIMKYE